MKDEVAHDVQGALQSLSGEMAAMLNASVSAFAQHASASAMAVKKASDSQHDLEVAATAATAATHELNTMRGEMEALKSKLTASELRESQATQREEAIQIEREELLKKLALCHSQEKQSKQRTAEMEAEAQAQKLFNEIEHLKTDLACANAAAVSVTSSSHARQLFPDLDNVDAKEASTNQDFKNMKVPELKTELDKRGLDSNGVKVDLVTRLMVIIYQLNYCEQFITSDTFYGRDMSFKWLSRGYKKKQKRRMYLSPSTLVWSSS
jgi:chromosome segregation ATPase